MADNESVIDYINTLAAELPEDICALEKYAKENFVPIIRKETQTLLRFLLRTRKPENILEIGTAIGFSSIFMSEYMPKNCTITTIEKVKMRIEVAEKTIPASRNGDRIKLLKGDAIDVLKTLEPSFDMIFLDAAKAQYMNFLPEILRLLSQNGILITDNVLQDGSVASSKYSIERRDRTIHMRMREYLYEITHNDNLETTILRCGDGVALSCKK